MKKLLLIATIAVAFMSLAMGQNTINSSFFDHVNYVGAFGDNDWTSPWAEWDPDGAVYPAGGVEILPQTLAAGTTTRFSSGVSPCLGSADFSNPRLSGWATPVTYIGAFDGTNDWTSPWANFDPQTTTYPATTVTIPAGEITGTENWVNTNVYKLDGWVYVRDGGVLNIQAGTIIRGDKANKGAIIVERGGKINAIGTPTQPIVFTSNQLAGVRAAGDWGGIIVLGRAPINVAGGVSTIEGGVGSLYGGGTTPDPNDNSGTMQYVRIEFPGVAFAPNDEINGLTLGGVGRGTTIDHIQVSFSGDDSFEWFGGTVDHTHLIAIGAVDDDFDSDQGYIGRIQFGLIQRDPSIADVSQSRAFETDGDDGAGIQPFAQQTRPLYSNISMFGPFETPSTVVDPLHDVGLKIREGSECSIYNSFVAGFLYGLEIDGSASQAAAAANLLQLENVFIAGSKIRAFEDTDADSSYFVSPERANSVFIDNASLRIIDGWNPTAPDFQPDNSPQTYLLNGRVYVDSLATLIIDPGTIFRCTSQGQSIGNFNGSGIIVKRGGKIIAQGTAQKPIVFTSNQIEGERNPGDWGGIILLGSATVNQGEDPIIEGGLTEYYGGGTSPNDDDNSGILKYVRIEFAGYVFGAGNEINGLTMGGVGRGTTIDFVQVSYGNDDSFEWFGGTVNCKHLIAFRGDDDDFDGDQGWSGMVQYAVSLRDPNFNLSGSSNGFEISNDGDATFTPITHPIFSNVSLCLDPAHTGTSYGDAIQLKDNTEFECWNSLAFGYPTGLDFVGAGVIANANAGLIQIHSTFLADCGSLYDAVDEQNFFTNPARDNGTYPSYLNLQLIAPITLTSPDFRPQNPSVVRHRSYWTRSISGQVQYDNVSTPWGMPNVTVTINDNTSKGVVFSTTSDGSGNFNFPRLGEGSYFITCSSSEAWPLGAITGINALDGLAIQNHFSGTALLTGLPFEAADVTANGVINSSDAFTDLLRATNNPAPQWNAPDWTFEQKPFSVGSSNVNVNVKGLATGDVNRTWNGIY